MAWTSPPEMNSSFSRPARRTSSSIGKGLGHAGIVDLVEGAEVRLEIVHATRVDLPIARFFISRQADEAGFIRQIGMFHFPDEHDGFVGGGDSGRQGNSGPSGQAGRGASQAMPLRHHSGITRLWERCTTAPGFFGQHDGGVVAHSHEFLSGCDHEHAVAQGAAVLHGLTIP